MIIIMPPSTVVLREWNIIELKDFGSRHFVGFSIYDKIGRVSTPIQDFDDIAWEGVTESGSNYLFKGEPGLVHPDAFYVLNRVAGYGRIKYEWVYPTPQNTDGLH